MRNPKHQKSMTVPAFSIAMQMGKKKTTDFSS